jgi:hypothetical protein
VTPAEAGLMPKLEASGDAVICHRGGARGYRYVGIELPPMPGVPLQPGAAGTNTETTLDQLPRDIVFDRCSLHGDPQAGTGRRIAMKRGPSGGDRFVSGGLQGSGGRTRRRWRGGRARGRTRS